MSLSERQISQLIAIVEAAQVIIAEAIKGPKSDKSSGTEAKGMTRNRRSGRELAAFKKAIKAEQKAGTSVAALAERYGVTPSYVYQLR